MSESLQATIDKHNKMLEEFDPSFDDKVQKVCKEATSVIRRVLTEGSEYAETLSKTCQEFQGLLGSKAPVKPRKSMDDDEEQQGMVTPPLSPRYKARQLLAGLPLDWLDLIPQSKPLEQELTEMELKYELEDNQISKL